MSARTIAKIAALWAAGAAAQSVPVDRIELLGAVVGRVCRDKNGDGRCTDDEPGVAGARVLLETGQSAVTGPDGRYHLAAVDAREPERTLTKDPVTLLVQRNGYPRLAPGRHRVALDARGLAEGETVIPRAATVELPMGAAAIQNFAVRSRPSITRPVKAGYPAQAAPVARLEPDGLHYTLGGQAGPGDEVVVAGQQARVDPEGRYDAQVTLQPGTNRLPITVTSPAGAVRYFVEIVEVIRRPGNVLVVPRDFQETAALQLPVGRGGTAAAGVTYLRVTGEPGTVVSFEGDSVAIGASGEVHVPIEIKTGQNVVAMTLSKEGEPPRQVQLQLGAEFRPFFVALADLDPGYSFFRGMGKAAIQARVAGHAEVSFAGWDMAAQLDLRDDDLRIAAIGGHPEALLIPRQPERAERSRDPELYPIAWGDRSLGLVPNEPEGRLRFEARNERYGKVGYGPTRGVMEDAEIGRFHRVLYGPYVDLQAPIGPVKLGFKAFGQSGAVDPSRPLVSMPVHEEFESTSGSLYFLGHAGVVEGSERVRILVRDGLTGLPLFERHLLRGRDYELDWVAGRLLLARPLSFVYGPALLSADTLAAGYEPVLIVDYERVQLGGYGRQTAGGGLSVTAGPFAAGAGVARELQGPAGSPGYTLLRGRASATVGPLTVGAEAAKSWGEAVAADSFLLSDDGGLTTLAPTGTVSAGEAISVWLRGKGLFDSGHVHAAYRWRSAGFSDREHRDELTFRQLSVRAEQPVGDLVFDALADVRGSADPRVPFGAQPMNWRKFGGSAGYRFGDFLARLQAKYAELSAATDPLAGPLETGSHTSAGASLIWKLSPELSLSAGHVQTLLTQGTGLGALRDTFTSVGADLQVPTLGKFGAVVGYGPDYGPMAWVRAERQTGGDWYYGSYSVDVDGPSVGQGRAVAGVRSELAKGASAFVEEIATHDITGVRQARAAGISQDVGDAVRLEARYERGVRSPLGVPSLLHRDAVGATAMYIHGWLRAYARGEVRFDNGPSQLNPGIQVALEQHVASAALEANLPFHVQFSGRANLGDGYESGVRSRGFFEGTASLAYRAEQWMAIARYSLTRETVLGGASTVESIASLLPAVRFGDRFTLWGGLHAGWSSAAANSGVVLSGSLRPAVQVVGGLELAAEVAGRSSAPNGGDLYSVRGEGGWRFDDRTYVGVGYTVLGFLGTGMPTREMADRLYVRAELAL